MLYVSHISPELLVRQRGTATATSELIRLQCLHVVYIKHMAHRYFKALTEYLQQYSGAVALV